MKKLIILTIIILSSFVFVQARILPELEKVKEIKLLESNREDVRRIFAGYKLEKDEDQQHKDSFYTDSGDIEVWYAEAKCNEEDEESWEWNVSEWKTTGITFRLESPINFNDTNPILSKLGISSSKLKREKVYNNDDALFLYHNKDLGIAMVIEENKVIEISITPAKKYYSSMCNKQLAKKRSATKSWFTEPLKDRYKCILTNDPAYTETLILSVPEITATCSSQNAAQSENCSDGIKLIAVFANGKDPEGDTLTYAYTVSGGKIIGYGSKVIWDLSDVKPGTYTITAAVDDGCGFCGQSMTKTVVVKECPNCRQN